MNFYLNYLKAEEMEAGENPTIGILLCPEKNETHVEYALGGMSNRIFVSRYLPQVPTKDELESFVRQTRCRLEGCGSAGVRFGRPRILRTRSEGTLRGCSVPIRASRNMVSVKQAVQRLPADEWQAVVEELEHGA